MTARGIDFIGHEDWLSSSPDLNPLDYKIWQHLEEKVCAKPRQNLESLRASLAKAAAEIDMNVVTPVIGHATIAAIRPLFEEWLERRHGVLTFRLTQVLTGHGVFGRFLYRIGREETAGCSHCEDRPEDTVEHTVEVCPAWAEHRRVLVAAIGGGDLSRPALVEAMVRSETEWDAVTTFCEAVMLAKEVVEREKERAAAFLPGRRGRRPGRRGLRRDPRPP
ncbi:unnamed protein product [Parnassius mnemosyne]|uniref:Reverse transcriptase n=1 Tax=Parnassius mnemosyne TaxID=213953 RepID=A0AAV1KBT1_9NEOP